MEARRPFATLESHLTRPRKSCDFKRWQTSYMTTIVKVASGDALSRVNSRNPATGKMGASPIWRPRGVKSPEEGRAQHVFEYNSKLRQWIAVPAVE
jgi:hypothetical protein